MTTTTEPTVDRDQLVAHLQLLDSMNWGSWPDSRTWPSLGGVSYVANQYGGGLGTVIRFDCPVTVGDRRGTHFTLCALPRARRSIRGLISIA